MLYEPGTDAARRVTDFFDRIGEILGHPSRRESFAMYAMGLFGEGERKSIEPIAARATGDPRHASAGHQKLHHFVANSDWSDRDVRRAATRYAIAELEKRESIRTWVIDDTGFLKKGEHSVGVQRQYTGSAGKITNCQIGVSLTIATSTQQLPIDVALFLPQSWTEDAERRAKAKIPEDIVFRTKHELALDLIERALADGIPGEIILADSFYGHSRHFREAIRALGFDYGVGIYSSDRLYAAKGGQPSGELRTAKDIAIAHGRKRFRRYRWREGRSGWLSSRFAVLRVIVPEEGAMPSRAEWLVVEWPEHEAEPTRFILTTLAAKMKKKQIIRLVKERFRTEKAYEEMKGELGLDHFEGRSFRGWHHHVTVVLCCYAFVVAERVRRFPPSARRQGATRPISRAA